MLPSGSLLLSTGAARPELLAKRLWDEFAPQGHSRIDEVLTCDCERNSVAGERVEARNQVAEALLRIVVQRSRHLSWVVDVVKFKAVAALAGIKAHDETDRAVTRCQVRCATLLAGGAGEGIGLRHDLEVEFPDIRAGIPRAYLDVVGAAVGRLKLKQRWVGVLVDPAPRRR
jgi:hypothetical protein